MINSIKDGKETISADELNMLKKLFHDFVFEILGFKSEAQAAGGDNELVEGLMQTILEIRKQAKLNKDWTTADKIRDGLGSLNIEVKDTKEGAMWNKKG
jgi:cysteinyl-tRNA synthetase